MIVIDEKGNKRIISIHGSVIGTGVKKIIIAPNELLEVKSSQIGEYIFHLMSRLIPGGQIIIGDESVDQKKYMTMKQAFECGNDDIPFVDGEYNDEHTLTKKLILLHHHTPCIEAALSDQWQVKKAGPKVLTAEELIKGDRITDLIKKEGDSIRVKTFSLRCHNNGRLEMYLEFKKFYGEGRAGASMTEALINLKPYP
jgi:hypothetical protein